MIRRSIPRSVRPLTSAGSDFAVAEGVWTDPAKRLDMLRRHRVPGIESRPADTVQGMKHLSEEWVTLLRWLTASGVEYIAVGPAAEAIRGRAGRDGPLTIVPAPYGRNLERLSRTLRAAHARPRGGEGAVPIRFSASLLTESESWSLLCNEMYHLDLEIPVVARYSELLYEAGRCEIEPGLSVEVASNEELECRARALLHVDEPEIKITRRTPKRDDAHTPA